jgi:hypothetical protein
MRDLFFRTQRDRIYFLFHRSCPHASIPKSQFKSSSINPLAELFTRAWVLGLSQSTSLGTQMDTSTLPFERSFYIGIILAGIVYGEVTADAEFL